MANEIVLDDHDVIHLSSHVLYNNKTHKVHELISRIRTWSKSSKWEEVRHAALFFFEQDCQVLSANNNWQSGYIRFRLEFVPDQSEPEIDTKLVSLPLLLSGEPEAETAGEPEAQTENDQLV